MSSASMVGRVRRVAVVAGLALAALPAVPAQAVTVGQTGFDNVGCKRDVAADLSYVVPANGGTITSFSIASQPANAGTQLDFLVLRLTEGGTYLVVGHTGPVALVGTPIETFPSEIPVQGGDILGFQIATFLNGCGRNASPNTVVFSGLVDPPLNVGDTVTLNSPGFGLSLNLSANLVTGPTSKAQCKKGGWRGFGDMFRNQGACVTLFDEDQDQR